MARSRHMGKRMTQRGINEELVYLASKFGIKELCKDNAIKVTLNRKALQTLITELDTLRKLAVRSMDKGGIVVVKSEDGVEITTYSASSFDIRKSCMRRNKKLNRTYH